MTLTPSQLEVQNLVKEMYKTPYGDPWVMTPSQCVVFEIIFKRMHPRVNLKSFTRFGKSATVALAVLTRCVTHPEKWAIVAPSAIKARIIMGYIIDHIFDNSLTESSLEFDRSESSLKRLQMERSKNRLTFNLGTRNGKPLKSEIFIVSADSRNKQGGGDAVMGLGAENVVLDEAALIDDNIESKIFRMLGDNMDNFYLKIGNPFRRNHFLKSDKDPNYVSKSFDYHVGLEEGRLTEDFIQEARKKPNFDVLYENKFPEADVVDDRGFVCLITDVEFERCIAHIEPQGRIGLPRLSVDVARGGGNFNVWTLRWDNYATVLAKNQDPDTMSVATTTMQFAREHNVLEQNTFIDDTGVGGGVIDRLAQLRFFANGVKNQETPDDEMFLNRRAQNFWRLRQWLIDGGKLSPEHEKEWMEILNIKYRAMDSRKIQIMSKLIMARDGIESPDVVDSLSMSFDQINAYDPALQHEFLDNHIVSDPYAIL
jgi:hypothetical protein